MTLPDVAKMKWPIWISYGLVVLGASILAIRFDRKIPSSSDKSKQKKLSWNILCCYYSVVISGYMLVQYITDDSPNAEGDLLLGIQEWLVSMCSILLLPKIILNHRNLMIYFWLNSGIVIIGMFVLALFGDYGDVIWIFARISCGIAVAGIFFQMKPVEKEKKNLSVWICYLIVATGMLITVHFLDIGDYNRIFLWASFGLAALIVLIRTLKTNDASLKTGDKQISTSTSAQLTSPLNREDGKDEMRRTTTTDGMMRRQLTIDEAERTQPFS
ncbi:Hex3 protein [Candida orthopsilosis Co 90-125]|uniref:Hex3 protein n=1 Tax=Candida orthopsilosis (strain 90-125) TaxID=1136231 RepID=H8WXY8_CANO9|nr:Hex3 protein [Candida orthopsilosis Co 90-125]CCG20935.1 Hex3 protein [Candida orthopsilosis Co 90-125]